MQFGLVSALTKKKQSYSLVIFKRWEEKDKAMGILCLPPLDLFHGSLNFCEFGYILWQLFFKEQLLS